MKQLERTVRHFLREARWRTGLTQQDLAERSGLSIRTISDIERGYVRQPRATTLRLLARALGMTDAQTTDLLLVVHQSADGGR
jgi:transcriptional regulator with XRE-family HTH domain